MKNFFIALSASILCCYTSTDSKVNSAIENNLPEIQNISLIILGTIQDGGSPHIGCKKNCCKELFKHPDQNRNVVSLGIIDPEKIIKL